MRTPSQRHVPDQTRRRAGRPRLAAVALCLGLLGALVPTTAVAQDAPVGQGFAPNASDLRFILRQILIAERHAATATAEDPCGTLLGDDPFQIPAQGQGVELPWGLRTVDGSCNNLVASQGTFGAADQDFPRLVPANLRPAQAGTSYAQTSGTVVDAEPRMISNLVVDQTAGNPAAVAAAGSEAEVTPSGALVIPNVATDVGLSAPYNSWFTLFGQFFDHGLDLVNKGGVGNVFMPLADDDPLFVPGGNNFMILSRATHDGDHEATNQTSPFVDQSQTYTSHPSHQVFVRHYELDASGDPVASGRLLTGPGGGMADWTTVRAQAQQLLGIDLSDQDSTRVPLVATDPYGRFLPGPGGRPQLVTATGLVEGTAAAPTPASSALATGHAFLDDIAHHAVAGPGLVPDADPGTSDDDDAGTYDDEMLGAHFIAGDGRVNENIGLTAVHHVFHAEHNRLVDQVQDVITTDDPTMLDQWQLSPGVWNGERLFQAARFITEMEYQHLAFEEFARKVQPMVNPFGEGGTGYHTTIDPAIRAEFAHAVYRFGHSMLTESVDRVRRDGSRDDMQLLDAFLNPPAFLAGGRTPEQAAGDIVRGMTRQVGNELDEFVTEALRNDLLGLPLDLASLNMARARETGVPRLNEARRAFHADTGSSALAPYESWTDMGFALKHHETLVNLVAAYGTHPSVVAQTSLAGRRDAAVALVHGAAGADHVLVDDPSTTEDESADNPTGPVPDDAYAFLNSTVHEPVDEFGVPVEGGHADWLGDATATTTGVDDVDLWVGGLAEKQMVFGGLLGPTFNHVFEAQMEDLQDGDRFYYLTRTAGLNLLTQLEGNSFAELIQRNTDAVSLPADSFARPDYVFDVAALGTSGAILDDPATDYDESVLLTRRPDGTIRYAGEAHAVFNGTVGPDRLWSSEGDDTLRGNDGDDRLEGGDGADNLIGGLGDDILIDLFGDDNLKGGDGDDVLSSGQGFGGDLNQGGRGNDAIIGGNDATETFAGPGNDLVYAGDGDDTVFGDDGDDWLEGGGGAFNLLQGDNGAPFQDDPNEPGHDVLIGSGGESDFDAEGGDDVMVAAPGIQRSEGMLGFDWVTHLRDPAPADADMAFTGLLPPSVETNRDRYDLVEALSGWVHDDVLRGDDRDAAAMVGHELDAAGIARIDGLDAVLEPGATSFTGGNLLLGGAGNDLLEGRGGDDLLDGDAWLNVRLVVVDAGGTPTMTVGTIAGLRTGLLSGAIDPGDVRIVREVLTSPTALAESDVAQFSGTRDEYDVVVDPDTGVVIVTHVGGTATDGTDTLRNVEVLRFTDGDVVIAEIPDPAPVASTDVIAVAFADTASGTTSPAQQVVVANTGDADLTVTGVEVVGTDATSFGTTTDCAVVVPGATCSVSVVFSPTGVGARQATLQISHDAVGSPLQVDLSGTGVEVVTVGPEVAVPAGVDFGARRLGTSRTVQVRLVNLGPGDLVVDQASATGPFEVALGTCTAAVPVGRRCQLAVTFTPTATGPVTGTLTIVGNASGSPLLVPLTGTGR